MKAYAINNEWISLSELDEIIRSEVKVELSEGAKSTISKCRNFLDEKVKTSDALIYGINTGFGSLCNTAISKDDREKLQRNLVL